MRVGVVSLLLYEKIEQRGVSIVVILSMSSWTCRLGTQSPRTYCWPDERDP